MFNQIITILSVGKGYSFTPEGGTEPMTGCSMFYCSSDDLSKGLESDDGTLGCVPAKETMPLSFYDRAKENGVPCKAKAQFAMRVKGGKQVLSIVGLDFVK